MLRKVVGLLLGALMGLLGGYWWMMQASELPQGADDNDDSLFVALELAPFADKRELDGFDLDSLDGMESLYTIDDLDQVGVDPLPLDHELKQMAIFEFKEHGALEGLIRKLDDQRQEAQWQKDNLGWRSLVDEELRIFLRVDLHQFELWWHAVLASDHEQTLKTYYPNEDHPVWDLWRYRNDLGLIYANVSENESLAYE